MKVPIVLYSAEVATTGILSPLAGVDLNNAAILTPLVIIPQKWAIQVTGLTAANVVAAPTSWTVIVQPSLDGLKFNDMATPFLQHVGPTNANGDVVTSGSTAAQFFPIRFYKVNVSALTLGATATKIRITVMAVE